MKQDLSHYNNKTKMEPHPSFFSATKSLEESPSKPANKELKPNINEVLKKVSTAQTTQVVVDSTILPRQDICMKPLSEYMIKGSFQLSPVPQHQVFKACMKTIKEANSNYYFSIKEKCLTNQESSSIYM